MSKRLINALNEDLSLELGAITQYMWHHVMATGLESPEIKEIFQKIAIVEMKHAEKFAERINYLGGTPTIKLAPVKVGGNLKKMIQDDLAGERNAIKKYKADLKIARQEGDVITERMLEEIIGDEEEHDDTWSTTLGVKGLYE